MISSIRNQFFISRPRRFGKTLLCYTLKSLFEGKRELFKGLAISKTKWKWEKYPVIRLDMSAGAYSEGISGCKSAISEQLKDNAENFSVKLSGETLTDKFKSLITGITKFVHISIFSALNNLTDITLDSEYAALLGVTQSELERDFADYISKWAKDYGGKKQYLEKLMKSLLLEKYFREKLAEEEIDLKMLDMEGM
jgi:hypothetical protein